MNVSVKYIYENFINELSPIFEQYGLEFNKPSNSFIKKFEQGRQYFNIDKMSGGIEVGLHVKIVNSIVKEIVQKVINIKHSAHMSSLWWDSHWYFKNYEKERFFIIEPKEIDFGKKNVIELLKNFALPAFEKYSSIEGIDSLVNNDSEYPLLTNKSHSTNITLIIYTGLITAKLLNRPDYKEIEQRNLSNLDRFDIEEKDACMARFNAIDFDKYRKQSNLG